MANFYTDEKLSFIALSTLSVSRSISSLVGISEKKPHVFAHWPQCPPWELLLKRSWIKINLQNVIRPQRKKNKKIIFSFVLIINSLFCHINNKGIFVGMFLLENHVYNDVFIIVIPGSSLNISFVTMNSS